MIVSHENDIQEVTSVLVTQTAPPALPLALLNIDVDEEELNNPVWRNVTCQKKGFGVALYQLRLKMGWRSVEFCHLGHLSSRQLSGFLREILSSSSVENTRVHLRKERKIPN